MKDTATFIEVSKSSLIQNLGIFRSLAGSATMMPILKSNAYGHGIKEIYKMLANQKVTIIGVNQIDEAESLRSMGYTGRILIMGPIETHDILQAHLAHAEITLRDEAFFHAWSRCNPRPLAHLKIDTGMCRQGLKPESYKSAIDVIKEFKSDIVGIYSHFANVEDVLEHDYAERQLKLFNEAVVMTRQGGINAQAHMASSASTLLLKQSRFDMVRIGISLYGMWPSSKTRLSYKQLTNQTLPLEPVLSWKTRILSVKQVNQGEYIGYGCTYKALGNMTIGVLPVGYYEGYPRAASEHNGPYVLIHGQRSPVVGRVCMNMMMVDITHLPAAKLNDQVTLIGRDGKEEIHAAQIGEWSGTIHYEIVSRLDKSIPRIITD